MKSPCCPTCGKPTTLYSFGGIKPLREDAAYRKRIRNLIAQFQIGGYNTYEQDLSVSCAVAQMMAVGGAQPHLQQILSTHMERIVASQLMETA